MNACKSFSSSTRYFTCCGILHPGFLTKVRHALFLPKNGCCISSPELNALYHDSKVLNGTVLAHVVHCANCLDQINQLRGLPTLSERQTDNGEGRERPPRTPGGNGGPPNSSSQRGLQGALQLG